MPPHVAGSDTSFAAAESIEPHCGRLQAAVLKYIRSCGDDGATDDEVEAALSLRHQTASARRRELYLKSLIVDSERRRPTRTRRLATVWIPNRQGVPNILISRRTRSGPPRELPAYVAGSDTSAAAAESIAPHCGRLQAAVLKHIRSCGDQGATDDEIEAALGLRHQTSAPRRYELVLKSLILGSERRRRTRSGRLATVWVLNQKGGDK
jgi:transcription initiation factor IIE alpha subunit